MSAEWEAIVVGGGPAGLSAALWLARYRRPTLVIDSGEPRNEAAWAVHGYPGLEDPHPEELRQLIRCQAEDAGARIREGTVASITGGKDAFELALGDGDTVGARRVVLAYGRHDRVPDIPGIDALYGRSVFHCPDCDGPLVAGETVGVLGRDRPAAALALYLLTWAERTVLMTNGLEPDLPDGAAATLDRHGVEIRREPVTRLTGTDGQLERAELAGAGDLPLGALFFHWGSHPSSALGPATGCDCSESGDLLVDSSLETSVAGIYAAGDIVGRPHLATSAVAGGVRAALALHRSLLPAEFKL